ncbi:MAG: helix-turn-helix domain-containing protein [Candidatus Methanoculleus thermohydrogenotrophicum]
MRKTYQYRLYPTKRQTSTLERSLDICRKVYNGTLAYRKHLYETEGKSVSLYDTNNLLPQ